MHITQSKFLSFVCWPLMKFCEYLSLNHPVVMTQLRYIARFHKLANIKNPKDLNEKILWLKFHCDIKEWGVLSDKYRVREYVEQRLGNDSNLVKLYGVWKDANDIDFNSLPSSFVLKGNNGSGSNILVKDKGKLDIEKTCKQMNKWIHTTIGLYSAELQYMYIEPRIIAEELLPSEKGSDSVSDYKVWCFNGVPHFIIVYSNRNDKSFLDADMMIYDTDWKAHPEYIKQDSLYHLGSIMEKPNNLNELLEVAAKLSKGHPCVRVDLYNVNEHVYFGEMTFTSSGGMMDHFSQDFLDLAGSMIVLK